MYIVNKWATPLVTPRTYAIKKTEKKTTVGTFSADLIEGKYYEIGKCW